MQFETRRYRVPDGINVAADVGGDPSHPAVILLHGGGQTRHSWGGAMRQLVSRGYHVINLDARGHGDSDWSPEANYSMEAMAADLRAVIATLSSRAALVGASMGGATSLYCVGNAASPIAQALVLVDVIPRVNMEGADRIRAFMSARPEGFANLDEVADAVAAYNPHRPRPRDPSGLMKNLRLREDGRLHWHWDPRFLNIGKRLEPPLFAMQLLDAAKRVRIPTLLVRGVQSDIVTEEGIEELRHHLPALEVYHVADAGHMVAGDKNDAFNRAIVSFLNHHLPATA